MEIPFNTDTEKKKNIRLALGVASLGFLGFFCIYLFFIGIMFFSPWRLFSLFPFPSISEDAVGLDGKLLLFSKNIDFRAAAGGNHPQEMKTLRVYDGRTLSEPVEVKQFSSLYPTGSKVYFFDRGLYRTFDGEKWEESRNGSIGSGPKGAVGPQGLWILSTVKNKTALNLITDKEVREIPLPNGGAGDKIRICSAQILSAGNSLHLFWKDEGNVFWSRFDGKTWGESQSFEGSGWYRAVAYKDRIYLIGNRSLGERSSVTLRFYDNGQWSEPKVLPIDKTLFDSIPAVFNENLIVFQRGFYSSNYYLIEDSGNRVRGPFHIQRELLLSGNNLWKLAALVLIPNIFFFVLIFLLSLLIRRFKLKTWEINSEEYEFASLFRRFLAKLIDSFIVTIPAALILYPVFKGGELLNNPFRFVGLILIFAISQILGSFFYHSLLEGLWGQTAGKKLCRITVLSDDFTRCTVLKGFLRNLLRIIDSLFYYLVAVVSLAGTMKWQRLGDIAAGTVVVRYGQKKRIQS